MLEGGKLVEQPRRRVLPRFQDTVPLLQGSRLIQRSPSGGYIREVTIHWPPGCLTLVDVRVLHHTVQFCPEVGFLALDNATPAYAFYERVELDEEIIVEIQNTDDTNAHTITVTVNIEKDEDISIPTAPAPH